LFWITRLNIKFKKGLHNLKEKQRNHLNKQAIQTKFQSKKQLDEQKNSFILMSGNSELLLINKTLFMKYADVQTLCKIELSVNRNYVVC
jgi:hypothetical protein